MNISVEYIATLLLITEIVAMAARRLRIAYTISPFPSDGIALPKDLIFTPFLPL